MESKGKINGEGGKGDIMGVRTRRRGGTMKSGKNER